MDAPAGIQREISLIRAYGCMSEAVGFRIPTERLVSSISAFDWRESLIRLSVLAHMAGNPLSWHDDEAIRQATNDALLTVDQVQRSADLTRYLARTDRLLVHERVVALLQGLVLLHGADEGGRVPSDARIALWLLAANDYVGDWHDRPPPMMNPLHRMTAEMFASARNDTHENPGHLLGRATLLFRRPENRATPLSEPSTWALVERYAFPKGLYESYVRAWAPLYMHFVLPQSKMDSPRYVDLRRWGQSDPEVLALLSDLSIDRSEAVRELSGHLRGDLPDVGTFLHKRPFVRLSDDALLPLAPQYLANQLYFGLWDRFRRACAEQIGKRTGFKEQTWVCAFGYMFEQYCRLLTKESLAGADIEIHDPNTAAEELEDIVLLHDAEAIVISVKTSLIRPDVGREQRSHAKTFEWLRNQFFADAKSKKEHRGGVLRLLSNSVARVQATMQVRQVYPVLVTADALGYSAAMGQWLDQELPRWTKLTGAGVGTVAVCSIDDFENFLALVAHGVSPFEILRRREGDGWRHVRPHVFLAEVAKENGQTLQHPFLFGEYDKAADDMLKRLRAAEVVAAEAG
jgi:hypothetical protein